MLLTSPANPGKEHSYHSIREASIHEMVHAYNSILNPKMPLWLNEGSALFLTNDEPSQIDRHDQIPTFEQTQTSNPIEFSNMGGYDFAYTYLEFLNQKYGWDKVLSLLETSDYAKSIGENPERIYDQWLKFLELEYKINQ